MTPNTKRKDARLRRLLKNNPGRKFSQREIEARTGFAEDTIASIEAGALLKLRTAFSRIFPSVTRELVHV